MRIGVAFETNALIADRDYWMPLLKARYAGHTVFWWGEPQGQLMRDADIEMGPA